MQNLLHKFVIGCLWVVPFLVLYVADGHFISQFSDSSGLFFPFISGKNFAFRTIIEIAFGAYIILAIRNPEYRPRISKLFIAYGSFIAIIFVADIFGINPMRSLFSNYERMEGFMMHIHLFLYFVMLVGMFKTPASWKTYLNVFITSNVVVMSIGLLQLIGSPTFIFSKIAPDFQKGMNEMFPIHQSLDRLDSTIGNSAYYAIYVLLFAFISAILFTQTKNIKAKWFYGILVFLNLVSLYYSGTRGTMIGFAVAILLIVAIYGGICLFNFLKKKTALSDLWLKIISVLLISVGTIVITATILFSLSTVKDTDFVKNSRTLSRFASISMTDLTTMSRFMIWEMSYEGFKERPILGYGQDNFQDVFAKTYNPGMYAQEAWFDRSHNVFFDWLIAGGILGLLSYLSLFAVAIWMLWFRKNNFKLIEKSLISGALIAYFVHNMFVFDNLTSYILFFTILAYISIHGETEVKNIKGRDLSSLASYVEPLVLVIVVISLWYVNYKPYIANTLLIRALNVQVLQQKMNTAEVIKAQNKAIADALELNTFGNQEVREQFMQIASRAANLDISSVSQNDQTVIGKSITDLVESAIAEINKVAPIQKEDVRALGIYGNFLNTIGDYTSAEKYLSQAHTLSPNKQILSFDLMQTYLSLNKTQEAYDLAKKTYLDAPAFVSAQSMFAISGAYSKNLKEVQQMFKENNQIIPANADVINSFVKTGEIKLAMSLLNDLKKEHPEAIKEIDDYISKLLKIK